MNTKQLRQKILDLAIRGKLVKQDPNDEPASVLLERVRAEKERLIKEGKIKRDKKDSVIIGGADKPRYGKEETTNIFPFEIPNSWTWSTIDEISESVSAGGDRPSVFSPVKSEKCPIPIFSNGITDNGLYGFTNIATVKNPSVTISARGTIGFSCVRYEPFCPIVRLITLTPNTRVVLLEYLQNALCNLIPQGEGSSIPQLTVPTIKPKPIPLPPLAEQRRIVSAIESAFAVIDEIERNKTDLQSAITAAKQKILSLAIRGKLVKQDPNDEPASVLLERIRSEKEKLISEGKIKRGKGDSAVIRSGDNPYYENLPGSWEIVSLSQITNSLILNDGDWILSENMVKNGDVKLIQLGSVGFMEYIDKGFKYLTSEVFYELNCTTIYPNYLLINRLLGDRLNLCILPDISGTLITTVDTCWIAPNENYNLKFLMYSIASELFQKSVFINSAGSTRKRISKGNLIQIPFSFPPLAEQNRIVVAIEAAFEQLDRIAENLN